MAQSKGMKKFFHMAYSIGASIVIIGALFKILHMSIGPLTGGILLMIGLGTEALIFFLSAFEPIPEDLDWTKVYPELAGGDATGAYDSLSLEAHGNDEQGMLSQKLDSLMAEAGLDAQMMQNLSSSIMSFKGAADNIAPAADAIASTNKYNEQLSMAAAQLETLNNLYKVQLESTSRQAEVNAEVAEHASQLKDQMQNLSQNMASLNGVYGGMLSAMSNK
jgi:gliding motility-associated protein GldL